jgi:hypothetical protein
MQTLAELIVLRNLVDSVLANDPSQSVQDNLYAARIKIVQAIREQNATSEVRRIA